MARRFSLALALVSLLSIPAQAVVIHDEGIDGDLSGVFATPDPLAVAAGANTIVAEMGANGETGATNGNDADYFSIVLGAGQSITAINVDAYTFSPGDPNVSFFGYTSGSGFSGQGGGDIDGNVLFNAASGNVLPLLAGGPLGTGTWSFWVQETSANVVDYQLTFTVVPEPSTAALLMLGLGGLAIRRVRSSRGRRSVIRP